MEENLISEDYLPLYETDELSYEINDSKRIGARLLRYLVAVVFISYAIVASVIDIRIGFYGIKLFLLGITCLLLFTPANYPYLLGLIISIYYLLKPHQLASVETSFVVKFMVLITISMAVANFFLRLLGNIRNPYHKFDLGSFCLVGLVVISFLGVFVMINRFLYFQRVMEIIGFGCAYSLGKSFLRDLDDLKMLLKGLCLGMFAYSWPWTVGYVMRHGLYVLGQLAEARAELGLVSKEAGSLLFIFALGFSISGSRLPLRVRRFAFWLLVIPSAMIILVLLSRAAILLMPLMVALVLVLSGRRVAALWTIIISGILGLLFVLYFGDIFLSIQQRMIALSAAASMRMQAYLTAIKIGLANPLFGIGAGQMHATGFWWHAHNDELTILAEHGIFAFSLYVLFWIYIIYVALRLRTADDIFLRTDLYHICRLKVTHGRRHFSANICGFVFSGYGGLPRIYSN